MSNAYKRAYVDSLLDVFKHLSEFIGKPNEFTVHCFAIAKVLNQTIIITVSSFNIQ